ncbi:MAG TPA: TRAP transporter substrate-binding protein, partial [Bradyrhizobium sp.]|nr:TRAP transporter substrate-binding protein [Bradyrhizobium sp.]
MSPPSAATDSPAPRRRRRFTALLAVASLLSLLTVALAAAFWVLQPASLRIAVGPAGSDDDRLVRAMAQAFDSKDSSIRLVPVPTDGQL